MSRDSFTEVSSESYFSRIGGSIKGILAGILLVMVALPLLFWNEGRAVKTYKTLKEGGGAVVTVSADSVDPGKEGKLVHVSGRAVTEDSLSDPEFGVSASAIKLRRVVEMYQWDEDVRSETRKKVGGGTETKKTYSYEKAWSESRINSSNFKVQEGHQNPASMPWQSQSWNASRVEVGAFKLSSSLVSEIGGWETLAAGSEAGLPPAVAGRGMASQGGYYIGSDPNVPQVGDLRVSFQVVQPQEVSLIAKQAGDTFGPYMASTGKSIEMLSMGVHTAEAMFQSAIASNKVMTWVLRGVGFLLMAIGFGMVFKPLSVIADLLPVAGNIVGAGTGLVAFLIAAVLSGITIAVSWLVYRPLLGIAILVVVVVLLVVLVKRLKAAKAPPRPAAPPAPAPVPPPPPPPAQG